MKQSSWQSMNSNFLIRSPPPKPVFVRSLCFSAVAGIIKQVFLFYFKMGGVLVATTNRLPEDLYAADFRKEHFRSFLEILQARCVSFEMRSKQDYRRLHEEETSAYFLPEQPGWEEACSQVMGKLVEPRTLSVYSRLVQMKNVCETGAVRFDFSDLCGQSLGPADYLTLASTFHTLILDKVPVLTLLKKNEARRFITLLDALYECRCKLLINAAAAPESLFFPDTAATATDDDLLWTESYTKAQLDMSTPYRPNIASYTGRNKDEMVVSVVDRPVDSSKLSAFTGEDERFAFRRAVSRLYEMPSRRWWESVRHAPMKDLPWAKRDGAEDEGGEKEVRGFRHGASPFRRSEERPPSFWYGHFWGVMKWGRRAGRWGLGADAYREKKEERDTRE
jgi:peroxisome-assembly ATPase